MPPFSHVSNDAGIPACIPPMPVFRMYPADAGIPLQ